MLSIGSECALRILRHLPFNTSHILIASSALPEINKFPLKLNWTHSLRIVPDKNHHSQIDSTKFGEVAPSAQGLQDIIRTNEGPLNISSQINSRHPLEARVQDWEKTQHELKLEQYRRIFGASEPIKRVMELNIVEKTDFVPISLGGQSNVHRDILLNKDTSIDWEDIYTGMSQLKFLLVLENLLTDTKGFEKKSHTDFHTEMERKYNI
ncbi:hypothetical protein WICMUC_000045 [Wickerhamomyces mucosus]|uniref:Uncharacterized protein n=1 Tax=Wickerhamomyces mucosus TaxID=1378264 RepID=A0A9P8PZ84_9ASCO|nr:hypothetical protein WICMUC_000045 [Wickerhamomyces mucosus]